MGRARSHSTKVWVLVGVVDQEVCMLIEDSLLRVKSCIPETIGNALVGGGAGKDTDRGQRFRVQTTSMSLVSLRKVRIKRA